MSAELWTAIEAAAATGGALCARGGDPARWIAEQWSASGVSIDTRSLAPGEMFVALKDQRDGHEFVRSAFEKGACAALVARAPEDTPDGAPLLVVGDTLEALRALARAARTRNFGKRIAVTGSAGKTSVKEMLRTALAASGAVHAADKSFNNHFGVPLTLARLPLRADYAVIEIGMNHRGEIAPLTRIVRPHVAIITTVAPAHLEHLGAIENIAEEKADIFLGLEPGGAAILPADNPQFPRLLARARAAGAGRVIAFGAASGADLRLVDYAETNGAGAIRAEIFGKATAYALGAPGRHQALNSLAVVAAAEAVGAPIEGTLAALAGHRAAEGRGARKEVAAGAGTAVLIDESYNANPASMAAALALLGAARPGPRGRRVAVLGDMLELGPQSPEFHAALIDAVLAAKVERLYVAGDMMRHLWEKAPARIRAAAAPQAAGLVDAVLADLRDGDIVMVKGSNGSRVSAVARALESSKGAARPAGAA
jgi:UDP-N-acetylmuramoyl-tripeptide--D-alanyl-D-alanine ligase